MVKCGLKKKIGAGVVTFMMIGGIGFAAQPNSVYTNAMQNMMAHPQGEYTADFDMDMHLTKLTMGHLIDVRETPFQFKMVGYTKHGGKVENNLSTLYAEQVGKQLIIYNGENKNGTMTWTKKVTQLDSDAPIAQTFTKNHNVLAGVKSIENTGNNTFKVAYDTSSIYKPGDVDKMIKGGMTRKNAEDTAHMMEGLAKAGDIVLNVTVDPNTNRISHINSTLSKQVNSIFDSALDNVNGSAFAKNIIRGLINSSTSTLTVDCKALPANADLSVPQEVKDKAVLESDSKK
jgi:hypothetical protein